MLLHFHHWTGAVVDPEEEVAHSFHVDDADDGSERIEPPHAEAGSPLSLPRHLHELVQVSVPWLIAADRRRRRPPWTGCSDEKWLSRWSASRGLLPLSFFFWVSVALPAGHQGLCCLYGARGAGGARRPPASRRSPSPEPHPESRTRTARVPGRQAAIHVEKDEGDRATAAANPSREKEVKNSTASRQDQLGAKLELNRKGALSIILLLDL